MTTALWEDVTPSFLRETYVLFAAQLTLDFPGGYGMFGRRLEKHRGEPVTDGQVAFLYYRAGTESGLMTATAAAKAIVPRGSGAILVGIDYGKFRSVNSFIFIPPACHYAKTVPEDIIGMPLRLNFANLGRLRIFIFFMLEGEYIKLFLYI